MLFIIRFAQKARSTQRTAKGTQARVRNLMMVQLRGAEKPLAAIRMRAGEVPLIIVSLQMRI